MFHYYKQVTLNLECIIIINRGSFKYAKISSNVYADTGLGQAQKTSINIFLESLCTQG